MQVSREIMAICREASHYSDICTLALPAHQRCQKNFLTCQTLIWWWCKKQPTCFVFIYFAGVVWQLIADVFMQKLYDGMMKACWIWCDKSVLSSLMLDLWAMPERKRSFFKGPIPNAEIPDMKWAVSPITRDRCLCFLVCYCSFLSDPGPIIVYPCQ